MALEGTGSNGGRYAGKVTTTTSKKPTTATAPRVSAPANIPVNNMFSDLPVAPITPIKPQTPQTSSKSATSAKSAGVSYSGGGVGTTPTGAVAETAAAPSGPQSYDAWKTGGGNIGDSTWTAQNAAAEAEYQNLLNSLALQNTNYLNDWRSGLKSLGWKAGADDTGSWDPTDLLGAYGQTFNNLQNDYSGRGLLDSTFYGQAQEDMNRRFEQQRNDMNQARLATNNTYGADRANAARTRQSAQDQALAEAYARYTSNYGV